MANTLFGEIVEPSSRAVFELCDDSNSDNQIQLKWTTPRITEQFNIKTLYIIEGKAIAEFMLKFVPGLKLLNSISDVNCNLYSVDQTTYVVMVKSIDVLTAGEITELLQDYILTAEDVILLQFKSKSEYLGADDGSSAIIKGIYCNIDEQYAPKLQQPNIVSGVCAAALHLRSHMNKGAALYVCYLEGSDYLDSPEVFALLKKLNIEGCLKSTSFNFIPKTNMYI